LAHEPVEIDVMVAPATGAVGDGDGQRRYATSASGFRKLYPQDALLFGEAPYLLIVTSALLLVVFGNLADVAVSDWPIALFEMADL
jgi:hypothetical protein